VVTVVDGLEAVVAVVVVVVAEVVVADSSDLCVQAAVIIARAVRMTRTRFMFAAPFLPSSNPCANDPLINVLPGRTFNQGTSAVLFDPVEDHRIELPIPVDIDTARRSGTRQLCRNGEPEPLPDPPSGRDDRRVVQ